MGKALRFDMHALSAAGGRSSNQDAWHVKLLSDALCCVVADGAGGHVGGAEASAIAVAAAGEAWTRQPAFDAAAVAQALRAADRAVVSGQEGDPELSDMRTTAVMLVLDVQRRLAAWGSIGDSRLYLFRGRTELFRTRDHSLVEELLQAGVLSGDPSRSHPRRNVLTAALGGGYPEARTSPPQVTVEAGDAFLLCSDGFWEYVFEPDVLAALETPGADARAILAALEHLLLSRAPRNHDNYTALLIRLLPAQADPSVSP